MKKVAILAWNCWLDNLGSRFYAISIIFGIVILYISLLLGMLAADQELRVLLDFGLGFIELMGLAGAVFGAATAVLREIESKTIYLILTRPVSRSQYLAGRFLGLMFSALVSMLIMAVLHLAILFFKGWTWDRAYLLAFVGIYFKVLITAAVTLFLSLFSSSVLTAMIIAAILWTLGHFLPEIRVMTPWARPALWPLAGLSYVIPDLQLFNLRDRLADPQWPLLAWTGYAFVYSLAWLMLAGFWLRKKEF
ncbi:MAG: hypothetical protein A3J70_13600 [Elusimicrobia bacterium RIFCSPHIGHO2_02_FULL_61_10]|nr:MAG: hypothetical protein A3J70_13600 [Elusimicrobia bacterium RIFCSPHIGHO2_02_FULL_61_10]